MRILVADDESKIAQFIRKGLKEEGYAVDIASDGDEAMNLALHEDYDAVVLDIMLPGIDGIGVLKKIRATRPDLPVMLVSARDQVSDKVRGLDAGADDYLTKPFAFEELLARLRALLRPRVRPDSTLSYADLSLDLRTHKASRGGTTIELSNREYALLEYFMRNEDQVITRTMIANHVWDLNFDTDTNIVDVYVAYLRKKIDGDRDVHLIRTVRGRGYMLSEHEKP
jgi:DNA-binding response OmpR family regulator